jgi:hypothetical protein
MGYQRNQQILYGGKIMAIKQFKDYDTTKAYTDGEQLPRGSYVCKIMGAKVENGDYGQYVKIAFDIEEGDYAGYYQQRYDNNTNEDKRWPGVFLLNVPTDDGSEKDGWTKRRFRTFTDALEESNPGYHFDWDESKFKGKLVGICFNYREYKKNDGDTGMSPNAAKVCSAEKARNGSVKIPEDKLLKDGSSHGSRSHSSAPTINDFVNNTEPELNF